MNTRARHITSVVPTGESLFRTLEPAFLAVIVAHASYLLFTQRVPATVIAFAALGIVVLNLILALLWLAPKRRDLGALNFIRGLMVYACSWPFVAQGIDFHASLIWLIATVGLYAIVLPRGLAIAFTAIVAAADPFLTHGLRPVSTHWLAQHVAAIMLLGLIGSLLGRALSISGQMMHSHRREQLKFQAITSNLNQVVLICDEHIQLVYVNPSVARVLGYTEEQFSQRWSSDLIHEDDRKRASDLLARVLQPVAKAEALLIRIQHASGPWRWYEVRAVNLLANPAVRGIVITLLDVTQRVETERKLFEDKQLLKTVFEAVPLYIYTKDKLGRYSMTNSANVRRMGMQSEDQVIGKLPSDIIAQPLASEIDAADQRVLSSGIGFVGREELREAPDGAALQWLSVSKLPIKSKDGGVVGLVGITQDITQRKDFETQLAHQARHDPLTGLPNRRFVIEKIGQSMEAARHGNYPLAVIFCDLDFFKAINDTHGHEMGDAFLIQLSERLKTRVRAGDTLARMGGDEFVVLCRNMRDEEEAIRVATRILEAARNPVIIDGTELKAEASVGLAFLRQEHRTAEDLIRDADTAMYQAKERGRNRIVIFDEQLRSRAMQRAQIAQDLRFALDRGETYLVYQPKVNLRTGKLKGFEVLMRWKSTTHGEVSPGVFIPIAEESDTITALGSWCLRTACAQLRKWQTRFNNLEQVSVAVNVSTRQLLTDKFVAEVDEVLRSTGLPPHCLELEVTESAAMANPNQVIDLLTRIRALGVKIALDDFGTGYSSLAYVQKLPLDVIKIDRSFVMGLGQSASDSEIVRLVLALAQTLHLESVAEGVETPGNVAELKQLGCDTGQGYIFSKPLRVVDAEHILDMGQQFVVSAQPPASTAAAPAPASPLV